MKFFYTCFLLFLIGSTYAQEKDSSNGSQLSAITVKAFESSRRLKDVAASVSYINGATLERFGTSSIVNAVNSNAGVRMEERSPGSYRLNIRGSSLRSPFGVRNIKIYFNDLPFTDPGGHSYLNGLGYYNIGSIEIIKGPGSSVYGSGTGGALLIGSLDANEKPSVFTELTAGSFGLKNAYASVTTSGTGSMNKIGLQFQESEGYRFHSAMERSVASWSGYFSPSTASVLKTTVLYSHLFYETPGALTKAEYEKDPRAFRPAGGGFPGAEQNGASIRQKTFLAGLSHRYRFSDQFSNTTAAYGMFTELTNPAIRNYSISNEPHTGGRTTFSYRNESSYGRFEAVAGAEIQLGFTSLSVARNNAGQADSLVSLDELPTRQSFVFLQASFERNGLELSAGGSLNYLLLKFKRTYPGAGFSRERRFANEFAPRVSLARKLPGVTLYTSMARGFSPPTLSELLPSGSAINLSLNAEHGVNNDFGLKGVFKDVSFDVNAFVFRLSNTIVQRRDAGGGDYFVNTGKTLQKGIETSLSYPLLQQVPTLRRSILWFNHTWHRFGYKEFKQLSADYSGNRLPGVAPHTVSTGLDVICKTGWLANVNYYYSGKIPLNDANSEFAKAYHLLHAKIGMEKQLKNRWLLKLVAGAENLLDQTYSLGPDVNGFGGRYYNAAPGRSFFVSLVVRFFQNKTGG